MQATVSSYAMRGTQRRQGQVALSPAAKAGLRIAGALAIGVGLAAFAYMVLPTLSATGPLGYALGFLINGVTSASIFVPVPGMAALVVMSGELNPWILAGFAGVGGAIGELFGYWLGSQGRGTLGRNRAFAQVQARVQRYGGPVVFLFAAVPVLPMDAAAMAAGATRYPVTRFIAFMTAGKVLLLVTVFSMSGLVLN